MLDQVYTLDIVNMNFYLISEMNNTVFFSVPTPERTIIRLSPQNFFAGPANQSISYFDILLQFPTAFYYNAQTGIILTGEFVKQRAFPKSSSFPSTPTNLLLRRSKHDSLKPPHGPQVLYLTSVGYGKEVGLPDGMQEIYNPLTKNSLVLDHRSCKIFSKSNPNKDKVVVKHVHHSCGDLIVPSMPADLCFQASIIQEAYVRAKSKPIGCTLSFVGKNGVDGLNGSPGLNGANGQRSGISGGNGEDGGKGGNGKPGQNANRGGDAVIILNGSADELDVTGNISLKVPLGSTRSEQVLLVDCHGGNGGQGGFAGKGGDGGCGANGGNGSDGQKGRQRGEWGDNGQDGGDGGSGGYGGQGGDAADGGNAGDGGRCVIQAQDPRLFALVEADVMPGNPGAGVKGGTGGKGGNAGSGGSGGQGGDGGPPKISSQSYSQSTDTQYYYPPPGRHGRQGRQGKPGRSGISGLDSRPGVKGRNGGMLWVIYGDNGIISAAGSRYNATVESLNVVPMCDDGVLEPHERIYISSLQIHNDGGLDLPSGAFISFPSSEMIKFESCQIEIPEHAVPAGKKYTSPFKFFGRISDLAPPNAAGPQSFKVEFSPRIELLGRPFHNSYKKELVIQYPVQLGNLYSPKIMDQGEVAIFSVEIKNISNLPYGSNKESGGRVVLHLHFDSRIILLGYSETKEISPYEMSFDYSLADSTFVEIHSVPRRGKVIVRFKVLLECNAEVFDQCHWQVDLHLRDKLIEYNQRMVTVIPTYKHEAIPADALFITDSAMTRQEFVIWSHIFESVGLTFDIWDKGRYNGLSIDSQTKQRHPNSWRGRYTGKLILYPHCTDFKLFIDTDIVQHFHGAAFLEKPLKELNSSMVVYIPLTRSGEIAALKHLAKVHPSVPIPDNSYKGKHMSKPSEHDNPPPYVNCEKKIIQKMEEKDLRQAPLLVGRMTDIKSSGILTYSYGTIDVRQMPVLKSSKFLIVSDTEKLSNLSSFKPENGGPIVSRYSQAFLAVLYGISVPAKLSLMKRNPNRNGKKPCDAAFYLPDGSSASIEEVIMVILVKEVVDELFNLTTEVHRLKMLHDDIRDDPAAYVDCGRIILRGLNLLEKEYSRQRSAGLKHIFANQGYNKIKDMSKSIQKLLAGVGVNKSKLEKMLNFHQLQSSSRFHFCHQHFVGDNFWNLIDN